MALPARAPLALIAVTLCAPLLHRAVQFVRPVFLRHQARIEEQFAKLSGARVALANVIGVDPLAPPSSGDVPPGSLLNHSLGVAEPDESIHAIFGGSHGTAPSVAPSAPSPAGVIGGGGAGPSAKKE